jgi:hypothetical protein
VQWRDNTYEGAWQFVVGSPERSADVARWQGEEYGQDPGSTFAAGDADGTC